MSSNPYNSSTNLLKPTYTSGTVYNFTIVEVRYCDTSGTHVGVYVEMYQALKFT